MADWDIQTREAARQTVTNFCQFIETHKDEIIALQIFYSQPRCTPLTEDNLKQLAEAIAAPPLGLTTDKLWRAYEDSVFEHVRLCSKLKLAMATNAQESACDGLTLEVGAAERKRASMRAALLEHEAAFGHGAPALVSKPAL